MTLTEVILSTIVKYGVQMAFALSPIPAYLPQYFQMTKKSPNDSHHTSVAEPSDDTSSSTISPSNLHRRTTGNAIDYTNGINNIPKPSSQLTRNSSFGMMMNEDLHTKSSIDISSPIPMITKQHSPKFETSTNSGGTTGGAGGFSSTSILILLLSHILRIIYFLGCAFVFLFLDNHYHRNLGEIHYDLVLQSITMIAVQILLLSAVLQTRVLHHHHRNATTTTIDTITGTTSPTATSPPPTYKHYDNTKPFVWILRPSHFGQNDSTILLLLRQYVELLTVITAIVLFFNHHYMHPTDHIGFLTGIRDLSILLESCLGLPQLLFNYRRKDTSGLSLSMVLGWILGDLMKLFYFITPKKNSSNDLVMESLQKEEEAIAKLELRTNTNTKHSHHHHKSPSNEGMEVFICGCIFALIMDSIVWMQIVHWYPTEELIEFKKSIRRWWVRCVNEMQRVKVGISTFRQKHRIPSNKMKEHSSPRTLFKSNDP